MPMFSGRSCAPLRPHAARLVVDFPPVPLSPLKVPILDHYAPAGVVCKVDANRAPADVWEAIAANLPK